MASSSGSMGDYGKKKNSIVIVDMPVELINRDILKEHFEKFGTVARLACSVSKKYAVVHFSTAEEAENAAANGTVIKADAPPLKIFNRDSSELRTKPSPAPDPSTSGTSERFVTRRKIVRTVTNTGSSGPLGTPTPLIRREPVFSSSKPVPFMSSVSNKMLEDAESIENQPSSSATVQQGFGPLKASVKISRPSPFLRKKPSFGEKFGKSVPSVNKNPFALPPRNKLSLDRRKQTQTYAKSSSIVDAIPKVDANTAGKSVQSLSEALKLPQIQETPCSSSEIILPDEDENDEESRVAQDDEEGETERFGCDRLDADFQQDSSPPDVEPTSTLDVDETTEDAILNDEDADANDNVENKEDVDIDEENILAEGETDTQDTAEVSTEEEGEIHDDDDQEGEDEDRNEENDDADDDVYESPLKRAEEKAYDKEQSTASSISPFSFKLSTAKTTHSATTGTSPSSLFKVPFTSPFALGDAPKPFTSSSFGIQLNASNMSKIFAGSSTSPAPSISTTKSEKDTEKSKDKSKGKANNSSSQPTEKESLTEQEKPKGFPFGLFSSFTSNSSTSKSITLGTVGTRSSSGSNEEVKPLTSSAPKSNMSTLASSGTGAVQDSKKSGGMGSPSTSGTSFSVSVQSPYQGQKDLPNPLLVSFIPDTPEAQELFAKRCNTVEDRYRILEARDKLIRSRIPKTKVNVEQATRLIGTCPDMCPEKERYMRQFQRQLVPYETLPGQDHVVDHQKAVKVYSRSSADQEEPLPHELRPGPTLDFTMHYLLRYIVPLGDDPDENLSDWYNFLWDRTRSIRKDITQQQIIDLTAVSLYEKCARFHIHCASRLCELDVHSFDPKLNDENLMKCLQSLEHLYEDLRRRQVTCPSEPEFRAYQIMMNLNEGDELYKAQQLPSWILNSDQVQTALKLHHSIYTKNFVAFFKTVENLPYMTSCILHRYFFQVRSLALRCFVKSHCTLPKYETAMPMSTLQRMLGYGTAVQSFNYLCETHGIHCDIEENKVILKRKLFYLPEFPSIYREEHLVDSKLQTSVAEAINGGPLPTIDFGNRIPKSSFNENGQLIPGDVVGSGSQDSKPGLFIPPQTIPVSKSASIFRPQLALATSSGFSFGGGFPQPKKEPVPPPKPIRQIESVCLAATSKLIEESIKQDVAKLSQDRLEEAKRLREEAAKRKHREEITTKLAAEYVERAISQHIDTLLQIQSAQNIRTFRKINEVTQTTASVLINEGVLINVGLSARTELILAKEYHHRLLRMLKRTFQRLRARFALERWRRFTKSRILEREREEEKRREELWNFPVINSYAMSTKDVFRAFCGKSNVQPSLDKVDSLSKSPEGLLLAPSARPKRKSEGDIERTNTSTKLPRMESDYEDKNKFNQMWDFPVVNPYSRTNGQVLEALCGKNSITNMPILPSVVSLGEKQMSESSIGSPFKIHRPTLKTNVGYGLGAEIRHKANESNLDLLSNIQNLLSQIKDERQRSKSLEPYMEGVEAVKKACPELNVSLDEVQQSEAEVDSDDEEHTDLMINADRGMHGSILSGAFIEEQNLLHRIQNFARQVRHEKSKSWTTDTFLNDIDLSIG